MRSHVFKLIAVLMLISVLAAPFSGQPVKANSQVMAVTPVKHSLTESENGIYIIRLNDASLATYQGGTAGLKATSPEATGARRLDTQTPASKAYLAYLDYKQNALIDNMAKAFGHPVDVVFQYKNVLNAVAVRIDYAEALGAFYLPDVSAVYADRVYQMETDSGPTLIGAPSIWNGDVPGDVGTQGEGIIIGVIDSGINHAHPSFADIGGDGYNHTNPYGYFGYCLTDPTFCNDKLIGAYNIVDTGAPEDVDGHGSHTASTAGGNFVDVTFDDGAGSTFDVTISGVAPHANLIAYRVCNPGCPSSASVMAVDYAIADGVDVLNYSISGSDDPWNDAVDLAFLDAYAAGIFVSASAGNAGPTAGTVAKTGPWNAAVAASTHNRIIAHPLDVVTDSGSLLGLGAVEGTGPALTADFTAPIIYGGDIDAANWEGCTAWAGTPFAGAIGMVQRGTCTFAVKVANLEAAGAVGVLVFNNAGGPPSVMGALEATTVPSMMISLNDGLEVVALISGDPSATTTMYVAQNFVYNDDWADIMAGFSSRGPSQWELLKPDYTAPGVNILAAVAAYGDDPVQYGFYQGTSMSSPHGAGSAALMVALHPAWSPAEIKSAIATTANQDVLDSDGVTPADPFDDGSGRIDLAAAAYAGFVLDETYDNYVAANPDLGGQPRDLNQPSMVNYACIGTCSWTRTIKSTTLDTQDWEITFDAPAEMILSASPMTFTLGAGATQEIVITADVSAGTVGQYYFGDLILTSTNLDLSVAHLPVAVLLNSSSLPGLVDIVTNVTPGSLTISDLQSLTEITKLNSRTFGLALGEATEVVLSQDATNSDPFDDLSQIFWTEVSISQGASRLVAEIVGSEAADVDLYIGTIGTAGGLPTADTIICTSASGVWAEYCNIDNPANGRYWVLVQNWSGTFTRPDRIELITTVVDDVDAGNMTITGPETVPATQPFDIDVNWDEPTMEAGQYWYGRFSLGTDQSHPDNLGYANVDLDFVGDFYDVYLYPEVSDGYGDPGITVPYVLTVYNTGNLDDTYSFTCDREGTPCDSTLDTWVVDLPADVFVPKGTSVDIGVNVTVPVDALAGDLDTVTITAQSTNQGSVLSSAEINTYANPVYDIDLIPVTDGLIGSPGDVVAYSLTLTNLGNAVDTVSLAASGYLWDVELPANSYTLNAGVSVNVAVLVTIPDTAVNGDEDVVTITATSSGGEVASSVLTTTSYDNDIALLPMTDAKAGEPGTTVTYSLELTNLTHLTDVVTLTASGNLWEVTWPTTPIDLTSYESVVVIVEVTIPADAELGDFDNVTITATSSRGDVSSSVLTTTASVEETGYFLYLPLVFKNPAE